MLTHPLEVFELPGVRSAVTSVHAFHQPAEEIKFLSADRRGEKYEQKNDREPLQGIFFLPGAIPPGAGHAFRDGHRKSIA